MHCESVLRRRLYGYLCIAALGAASAAAQSQNFEGRRIVSIDYAPASVLDPADLAKVQPLRQGELLRSEDVARAVDGLYSTGRFTDVSIEADNAPGGVALRVVTQAQWFVGGVDIEGKVVIPPNRGELHSGTGLVLGAPFNDSDIENATTSMTKLLEANGLYEAKITPNIDRQQDGQQVFVTFVIKAGKRAKYEQPEVTGTPMLSNDAILRATGWRIPIIHWWRQVTDSRTRTGVQALLGKYQKKDRLTARVELGALDYDSSRRRVKPHLAIDPGPKVQVKAVEAKISKRALKRYVPVFEEHAVDNDLLVEGKRNLEDYLQSQGYYDAEVDFRVTPVRNDEETVEYVISKGERHKVVQVNVTGNRYFDVHTIRERMFIAPASFLTLRHGRYSEAFRKKDEANIAELYKANGFRDVKVSTTVDTGFKGKLGDVAVSVKIEEGTQWIVDGLDIQGVSKEDLSGISGTLASAAGQPFADVNLAADRNAVLTYYFGQGYPAAAFKAAWQPSGAPNHVNVRYEVTEGDRQYVRDIITSGNHTTRPSLIKKTITLKPGEPLSPLKQTEIQKKFYDLGIFARVDTAVQNAGGTTDHKYVLYNFEEANRYTVNVGVGAQVARFGNPSSNSLAAPAGQTGFSPEFSLDVSRLNLWGRGHTASVRTLYSNIEKRGIVSYLQPRFYNNDGRSITYNLLYDDSFNVRTFSSRREEASAQISQIFSKSLTGLFRVAYRRVSVGNVVIPVLLVPQLLQPVRIGIATGTIVQDRRNDASNPSRGIFNTFDFGLATKALGSQRSFGRVLLRNATYYRLSKSLILARQTQFGVIAPFSVPSTLTPQSYIPLPERFFGGGADSLRAFAYNQAGPRDVGAPVVPGGPSSQPTGFPLGGNALFFNTVELRFPLLGENIQGVAFHDMGNVFSSIGNMSFRFHQRDLNDFDYSAHAVGFGIRYRTPVGPIRVDLSYSVNPPSFLGYSGTAAQLISCNPASPTPQPGCTITKQSSGHIQYFFSIGQTF